MGEFFQGFLDNDSYFGKFMTKLGIIIGANLMFVIFSIPGITIGAGLVALYHVMLKTLRGDGVLNPFKQFWIGFKSNFKQATICWIIVVLMVAFGYMDLQICKQAGGMIANFRYGIYVIGSIVLIIFLFLLPTMAAFADTIPHLIRNAVFFAVKRPFKTVVILFFDIFPMVLTYTDLQDLPLYAFLWTMCGFGLLAMLGSTLLLPEFKIYLPAVDGDGDFIVDPSEDEDKMMEDLRKLDGF